MKKYNEFINESNDITKYIVKIKPNINDKFKWYYGFPNKKNDMTGKKFLVKDAPEGGEFAGKFAWPASESGGTLFFDKDDCEIIETK